jgi:DNA excision repair protein ERCC-3
LKNKKYLLRAKSGNNLDDYNAYFYSIISSDTREVYFSMKRRRYLIEQGYNYHLLENIPPKDAQNLVYQKPEEIKQLLLNVLATDETEGDIEKIDDDVHLTQTVRKITSLGNISGSGGDIYFEF